MQPCSITLHTFTYVPHNRIYNQIKVRIGEIHEKGGLYCVSMPNSKESANSIRTADAISIDELHCHLGHISHDQAKLLVVGVNLEAESQATVCEFCEATRKAMRWGMVC